MPVPWLAIGVGLNIMSAASGIFSAGANKQQAQISSQIAKQQRRTSGDRELDALEMGMTLSGVEMTQDGNNNGYNATDDSRQRRGAGSRLNIAAGSDRIGYSAGKKGFLGIGQKDGGYIQNARSYSAATDSASLIMGTSRDSINLDISAINLDASNAAYAFTVEAFSAGLETFGAIASGINDLKEFYKVDKPAKSKKPVPKEPVDYYN